MAQQDYTIGMLYCFTGKFPWYFPYFLKTCSYNQSIDFIIITDQPDIYEHTSNVIFIHKTLEEINALATEKLGFATAINYAYKLCDFKPAYAVIFNEIIKSYDFWGLGDVDVILGDIRSFYTNELLKQYDVIMLIVK
jgi:hypothetical protein